MAESDLRPQIHEQVLVEADLSGRIVGFRAVVVNVMTDALWLGLVRPDALLDRLREGDPVGLTYRRDSAAFVAHTIFKGHLGSARTRIFAVEWCEETQRVQRRAHLRLDAVCPLDCIVASGEGAIEGRVISGRTRNVGAGGLQFEADVAVSASVDVGDAVELRLALDGELVLADADVVRVDDITDEDREGRPLPPAVPPRKPRTLIAVRFAFVSEAAQDAIVRYIFAQQRIRREAAEAIT